jgi:predicted exporter
VPSPSTLAKLYSANTPLWNHTHIWRSLVQLCLNSLLATLKYVWNHALKHLPPISAAISITNFPAMNLGGVEQVIFRYIWVWFQSGVLLQYKIFRKWIEFRWSWTSDLQIWVWFQSGVLLQYNLANVLN